MQNLHFHYFLFYNLFFLVKTSLDSRVIHLIDRLPKQIQYPKYELLPFCHSAFANIFIFTPSCPPEPLINLRISVIIGRRYTSSDNRIQRQVRGDDDEPDVSSPPRPDRVGLDHRPVWSVRNRLYLRYQTCTCQQRADCCPLRGSF